MNWILIANTTQVENTYFTMGVISVALIIIIVGIWGILHSSRKKEAEV